MTPTTTPTARVQRTVFDLTAFDDVKLVKTINLPAKPASLEEALGAVGNDTEKLLTVIHEGLVAEAKSVASETMEGFQTLNEDGTPGDAYTGKFVDEEKGKLINNAILSIAKINGYEKSLAPEKKRALKDQATAFLRDNPAMLLSLQS
jgi:hypothetical protein